MPERLRPADFRFLAICCALLAVTVWFSARYFYRAFPEASIDFRVTRDQARVRGATFLSGQGLHVDGYRQASRFNYDDTAKTFLEREAGLERIRGAFELAFAIVAKAADEILLRLASRYRFVDLVTRAL